MDFDFKVFAKSITSVAEELRDIALSDPRNDDANLILGASDMLRALRRERARLAARVEELESEAMCDACAGTGGNPDPNSRCMCGGTGKAIDAVNHLREVCMDQRDELDKLKDQNLQLSAAQGGTITGPEAA